MCVGATSVSSRLEQSNCGFVTQYDTYRAGNRIPGLVNSNDNLFATAASPGVTEVSADPTANAMMVYW